MNEASQILLTEFWNNITQGLDSLFGFYELVFLNLCSTEPWGSVKE
jgi:hypothetical protein